MIYLIILLMCNIILTGLLAFGVYRISNDLYQWRKERWDEQRALHKGTYVRDFRK